MSPLLDVIAVSRILYYISLSIMKSVHWGTQTDTTSCILPGIPLSLPPLLAMRTDDGLRHYSLKLPECIWRAPITQFAQSIKMASIMENDV